MGTRMNQPATEAGRETLMDLHDIPQDWLKRRIARIEAEARAASEVPPDCRDGHDVRMTTDFDGEPLRCVRCKAAPDRAGASEVPPPPLRPEIVCLCGDVFLDVPAMHEHFHMVHEGFEEIALHE